MCGVSHMESDLPTPSTDPGCTCLVPTLYFDQRYKKLKVTPKHTEEVPVATGFGVTIKVNLSLLAE